MLSFNDLSVSQRKWVSLVEMFHPEITDKITYKQIQEFHEEFMSLRSTNPQYKTGMPLWLIKPNALERGVYFFPSSKNTPPEQEAIVQTDIEKMYQQELQKFGIK